MGIAIFVCGEEIDESKRQEAKRRKGFMGRKRRKRRKRQKRQKRQKGQKGQKGDNRDQRDQRDGSDDLSVDKDFSSVSQVSFISMAWITTLKGDFANVS